MCVLTRDVLQIGRRQGRDDGRHGHASHGELKTTTTTTITSFTTTTITILLHLLQPPPLPQCRHNYHCSYKVRLRAEHKTRDVARGPRALCTRPLPPMSLLPPVCSSSSSHSTSPSRSSCMHSGHVASPSPFVIFTASASAARCTMHASPAVASPRPAWLLASDLVVSLLSMCWGMLRSRLRRCVAEVRRSGPGSWCSARVAWSAFNVPVPVRAVAGRRRSLTRSFLRTTLPGVLLLLCCACIVLLYDFEPRVGHRLLYLIIPTTTMHDCTL